MTNVFASTQRTLAVTTATVNTNPPADMPALALDLRAISLESALTDAKGLRITQMFNAFTGKVDDVLTSVFDKLPNREITFKKDNTVARKVLKADYSELRGFTAYIPPGLTVSYENYLIDVIDHELHWIKGNLIAKYIPGLENFLAKAATDVTRLRSSREIEAVMTIDEYSIEMETKHIATMYNSKSAATETLLGNVIGNGKDWDNVTSEAEKYSKAIHAIDHKSLKSAAENIHDYSKLISKRLSEMEEIDPATRKNVAKLSQAVFTAARVFEFIAVWQAECNEFFTAMADTQESLSKKL